MSWKTSIKDYCFPPGTMRHRLANRCYRAFHRAIWHARTLRIGGRGAMLSAAFDDPYDSRAFNAFLKACGWQRPFAWTPAAAEIDCYGAARVALGMLQHRPDLRQRFPRPLSDGEKGGYCQWLVTEGAREHRWSKRAQDHLREAFARRLGNQIFKNYDHDPGLRQVFPLAFIPNGREHFVRFLHFQKKPAPELRDEELWWFLFELAEDPHKGLAATYLRRPCWQERFPYAQTAFGQEEFKAWLEHEYQLNEYWLRAVDFTGFHDLAVQARLLHQGNETWKQRFPRAFADAHETARFVEEIQNDPALEASLNAAQWAELQQQCVAARWNCPGINLLAYFTYPSGLQQASLAVKAALERAGVNTACRDVPAFYEYALPGRDAYLNREVHDFTLVQVAPDWPVEKAYSLGGLWQRPGVFRIAQWYWELEDAPQHWARHARDIQEIWAPTRFIARALRKILKTPVIDMLPGVEVGHFPLLPRFRFGLPDDRFLFLFLFDMCSVMERKNPLGLIQAFRQAFRSDDRVALAIKVTRGHYDSTELARLQDAANDSGAILLQDTMSREESYALIHCCDAYVSLHRSEGFGLTMAEAMLMAKPVIATNYSGNTDFMSADNSCLVDYRRVPITRRLQHYPKGCHWAEPSIDHAAHWMRWLFEHPEEAAVLGRRAQEETKRRLSLEAAGRRMAERLRELQR